MVSQPQRILTIEEEKAAEFGKRLDVEVSESSRATSPMTTNFKQHSRKSLAHILSRTWNTGVHPLLNKREGRNATGLLCAAILPSMTPALCAWSRVRIETMARRWAHPNSTA